MKWTEKGKETLRSLSLRSHCRACRHAGPVRGCFWATETEPLDNFQFRSQYFSACKSFLEVVVHVAACSSLFCEAGAAAAVFCEPLFFLCHFPLSCASCSHTVFLLYVVFLLAVFVFFELSDL